ncbi:hypothetical protein Q0F98_03155 [Paenibacillus amylolyticus]|nr:hypothetical protein Q0F98_03155 [Paenibacillus amylolyticus]
MTNPLSQNLYTYVENNPLKYSDPGGNFKIRSADFLALKSFGITVGDYVQGEKIGKYDYDRAKDRKALTAAERYVVDILRHMGKDVYLNPAKVDSKQYDFKINGYHKVELKTANPEQGEFNLTSAMSAITYGIEKQGSLCGYI